MQNLKYDTNDCYYETETQTQRLTSTENRPRKRVCQGGGVAKEEGLIGSLGLVDANYDA